MASFFEHPTTNSRANNNRTLPPQQNSSTNHNNSNSNHFNNNNNNNNGSINSKKRCLDQLENSPYFKIRAFVNQLHPLIIQACTSPNLDTCEARHGIQEKVQLIMDQCKQQTAPVMNCNGSQKPPVLPRANQSSQEKRLPVGNNIVKKTHENRVIPGSYIVGGSAFGWNFLMFNGTKPEYYGRTKEAFRSGQSGGKDPA